RGSAEIPVGIGNGLGDVPRLILAIVVGRDTSDLIDGSTGIRREVFAKSLDVADGVQETVGLSEERVLLDVGRLIGGRAFVEVVGDHVQRDAGLVIFGVQE